MKYTTELLDEIIKNGFETDHVDFKIEFNWHTFNDFKKAKVAKHMAAMANIPGGGILIFGVADNRQVKGLSKADLESYDRTRLDQTLEKYLDPIPKYQVVTVKYGDKQLLIIEVEEFDDIPIITKIDEAKVFRAGGVYVRQNASSTIIHDARAMRRLVNLAVKKQKTELLESIENILDTGEEQDDWKL